MSQKLSRWFRPAVEMLEDRLAPANFTVSVTDQGDVAGSLRHALLALQNEAANSQNTINVTATGTITLTEALPIVNRDVTITGPGAANLTVTRSNAPNTASFSILQIATGSWNVQVAGLKLTNGSADWGGGILSRANLTLTNMEIRDNRATIYGGGVFSEDARLTITNSIISYNTAASSDQNLGSGGGVFLSVTTGVQRTIITGTTISHNTAKMDGGGIALRVLEGVGGLRVNGGSVSENNAGRWGAGIGSFAGLLDARSRVDITEGAEITNNTFRRVVGVDWVGGGGIYASAGADVLVDRARITDNGQFISEGPAGFTYGGGIYTSGGTVDIRNETVIAQNTATRWGGGIYNSGARMDIDRSQITRNTAQWGGGIYKVGDRIIEVTNSLIDRNTSTIGGGGTYQERANSIRGTNSTITLNSATNEGSTGVAGGVYVAEGGSAAFVNSIIAGNTDDSGSPDVFGAFDDLGHNLIGITDGSTGWTLSTLLGDAEDPFDPKFGEIAFHGGTIPTLVLLSDSPALDAGDDAYASGTDARGFTRVVGDHVDIGAVEMQSGEFSLAAPYAHAVDFSVSLGRTLAISETDDFNLLDYSGNDPLEVSIVEVNGESGDVGEEINTTHGGLLTLNSNGAFSYTAPNNYVGDDSFTYTISDGVSTRTGTVTLHVINTSVYDVNFSVLRDGYLTVSAGSGLLLSAYAASGEELEVTEVNGDDENLASATATAEGGSVTVQADGSFVYTPDTNFTGDDSFTFTISDGRAAADVFASDVQSI